MEDHLYTIDKVLNIRVKPEKYFNEFSALMHLKTGLIELYNQVRPVELKILEENHGSKIIFFGNSERVPEHIYRLLPCFFHWFGNSVCNYARLAGFIVSREQGYVSDADLQLEPERKKIKDACDTYVKNLPEIQEVLKWRNKVSAHFALTDPRKDDNISTLEASIIYPVVFTIDRFKTGIIMFSEFDGVINRNSEIPSWSLTEIFEVLINRFWSDVTLNI